MSTSYALLGLLAGESSYGYQLKNAYDRLFAASKPLAFGQVYATLSRLERDGKVQPVPDPEPSGGPDRVRYEITPNGNESLEEWLATPEAPTPNLQTTLYLKTVLALLRSKDANKYLDAQKRSHIARMRELTKARAQSSLGTVLLIDHAIFHLEADIRWIELTSGRLTQLQGEINQ